MTSDWPPELVEKIARCFARHRWECDPDLRTFEWEDFTYESKCVLDAIRDDIVLKSEIGNYLKDGLCDYGSAATDAVADIIDRLVR